MFTVSWRFLGGLALSLLVTSASAQETTRLGTEGGYPPYNFINDAGEIDGLERELGDELCKRAGLTCEWVVSDWDSIIPNLLSGNYDAIIADMAITPEREKTLNFTQNYLKPTISAFVGRSPDIDLNNSTVAAQANTAEANIISESGYTLVEFATPEETVTAVRNGEVDAVLADKAYLSSSVEDSDGDLVWIGEEIPIGKGVGIGVRQSDTGLRDALNTAIQTMKDDGTLNLLLVKWLADEADLY